MMDSAAVVEYLVDWLRKRVLEAEAKGVVLGISGGVDSAVAALIAKRAFPDNVLGLLLPCESSVSDRIDSQELVEKFDIPYRVIDLDNAYRLISTHFESYMKIEGPKGKLLRGNIKSRLRMMSLYYSAQARDYLVLGTSNKSEISVGYATQYGDGGVDLQLLGDLLKWEVYELARFLEVPPVIVNKTPSGGLWAGQTDEEELGFTYDELDAYLAHDTGAEEVIARIKAKQDASQHKREMPPTAVLPAELRE